MILSTFGLCVKDVGLFSEMAKGNDWQTMCGSLLSLLFNPAVTVLSLLDSHVWIRTEQQTRLYKDKWSFTPAAWLYPGGVLQIRVKQVHIITTAKDRNVARRTVQFLESAQSEPSLLTNQQRISEKENKLSISATDQLIVFIHTVCGSAAEGRVIFEVLFVSSGREQRLCVERGDNAGRITNPTSADWVYYASSPSFVHKVSLESMKNIKVPCCSFNFLDFGQTTTQSCVSTPAD